MTDKDIHIFRMPLMGEGVHEATIVKWLKQKGEPIKQNEALLQVSTDKVDTELPSPFSGIVVELLASADQKVHVDQALAIVSTSQINQSEVAQIAASLKQEQNLKTSVVAEEPSKVAPPNSKQSSGIRTLGGIDGLTTRRGAIASQDITRNSIKEGGVRSSPLVRRLAKEHGVDLGLVQGSGLNGRINAMDLQSYLENPSAHIQAILPSENTQSFNAQSLISASLKTQKKDDGSEYLEGVRIRREKMSRIRQLTADHMVRSVAISPHVTTVFEIDMSSVGAFIQKEKNSFAQKHPSAKLTYTPVVLYAAMKTIQEHPIVNVSVDGHDILWKDDINLGCAVAIDTGLIVPVLKKTQTMSLEELTIKFHDLVQKARTKQLQADDVVGGSFSLTNPGGFGSIHSNPIINQPQVAMLSMGAIVKRPMVGANDEISIKPMCMFGLTFDHRVIDGEGGAKFLASFKKIIEGAWSF